MSDRLDEWMLGNLHEYAGKPLKHVAKGELPLDEADKAKQEEATKAAAPLLERLKGLLGDRVEDVRVSARLTDSPSCLAMSEWEMAPHMAHLLREAGQDVPENKPTLEINPAHPLLKQVEAETADARATDLATLLLEQPELSAGAPPPDPAAFLQRLTRLLAGSPQAALAAAPRRAAPPKANTPPVHGPAN